MIVLEKISFPYQFSDRQCRIESVELDLPSFLIIAEEKGEVSLSFSMEDRLAAEVEDDLRTASVKPSGTRGESLVLTPGMRNLIVAAWEPSSDGNNLVVRYYLITIQEIQLGS